MKDLKYLIFIIVIIGLSVALDWYNDYNLPQYGANVVHVHDGDSFTANIKFGDGDVRRERVRVRNIDAPEIEGACAFETQKAQQSKKALSELILRTQVMLKDIGTDKYERTLAIVTTDDGINVADALIQSRDVRVYRGYKESWCK